MRDRFFSHSKWTFDLSEVPLESDELALEYLLLHNHDVEKAKFNILCRLGVGRGQ